MIETYPLCWPEGWPRAKSRSFGHFGKSATTGAGYQQKRNLTISEGAARVIGELRRMGVRESNVIVSTNVRPNRFGLPMGDSANPQDPGAAVYWTNGKRDVVMAIDQYTRLADNLGAIAATIEAMRAIERHGGAQILERAFTGFAALPAPGQTSRGWREVLGFPPHSKPAYSELDAVYKRLRSAAHPDKGGSHEAFMEVQTAFDQASKELHA